MGKIIKLSNISLNKYTTKTSINSNNKGHLHILIGIPRSGKSTYVKKYANNSNVIIISSDEIRKELTGTSTFCIETNDLVFDTIKKRIDYFLKNKFEVYYDATNLIRNYRKDIIHLAKKNNANIDAIIFNTSLSICIKRNDKRTSERKIPRDKLMNMYFNKDDVIISEGFDNIKYIEYRI